MGIDGACTVKLVRKNNGNAVKEFEDLTKYLNDLFAMVGKRIGCVNVREQEGYAECEATEESVTITIRSENDRNFFFHRCISETVCHMQPITEWSDLKWIPDGDHDWNGRMATICKRYDCWMTLVGGWDSCCEYGVWKAMDNNGVIRSNVKLPWDKQSKKPDSPTPEEVAFNAAKAESLKMIEDFING